MSITVEKPKPPKQRSYPLKTSVLANALTDAGIDVRVNVVYMPSDKRGVVFEAFFWLPNANVPHERVHIRAGTVPSQQRKTAAAQLETAVLPDFAEWIKRLLALPRNSTAILREPSFVAVWDGAQLRVERSPSA